MASGSEKSFDGSEGRGSELALDRRDSNDIEMSMTRTSSHGPFDGRSRQPLLEDEQQGRMSTGGFGDAEGRPMLHHHSRRSTMRSKSPDALAKQQTRQKYFIASGFLLLSLVSFVVQTETAVYIQHDLGWNKPYCML